MSQEPNLVFRCPKCEGMRVAKEQSRYLDSELLGRFAEMALIVTCAECDEMAVACCYGTQEQFENGSYGFDWGPLSVVYPGDKLEWFDPSVHPFIMNDFREAHRSFHVMSHKATVIMCRTVLESVCKDKGATGRNLAERIDDLKAKGFIDDMVRTWAHEVLRELGNEAAHEMDPVSSLDAEAALEFTRAILEYVYVFHASHESFKARRAERKAAKETAKLGGVKL